MVHTLRPRWSVRFPRQFEAAQREVEQLFDNFLGSRAAGSGNGQSGASAAFAPASLWEEEGRWCVEFDLPGVKQEDIDVTLDKNSLRLTAERRAPQEDRKFWHQERAYGKIERVITLPETVDPDAIEAELKEGVLRLHLAKRPELQPKKIQVKVS
jgi:HSP20 family protein